MDTEAERMRILEMIESGRITAEEGLHLLQALNGAEAEPEEVLEDLDSAEYSRAYHGAEVEAIASGPFGAEDDDLPNSGYAGEPEVVTFPRVDAGAAAGRLPAEAARWKRWWTIPLWAGVGVTVMGGLLMYAAIRPDGSISLWFMCASVPFALGVLLLALAWASRTSPWLHLRVQQAPGARPQRIALSFPLPLGLAAWVLRTFGRFMPSGIQEQRLDEVILAVGRSATQENPIHIQVDDDEDGEKVEIFIG